ANLGNRCAKWPQTGHPGYDKWQQHLDDREFLNFEKAVLRMKPRDVRKRRHGMPGKMMRTDPLMVNGGSFLLEHRTPDEVFTAEDLGDPCLKNRSHRSVSQFSSPPINLHSPTLR